MKLPSPAMFVSIAALVVAMGGTSYAAVTVNGNQIKAKSIDSSKIKKNTLGSGVIKDGKIKNKDLAADVSITKARWLYVDAAGNIALQSGGFSVVAAYPGTPDAAAGNVYINAGSDLKDNGITATLSLQNVANTGGPADINNGSAPGSDVNPEFSGEITVSKCNVPTQPSSANCAPVGAQNAQSFVVSPRLSDGSRTDASNRKGFYVIVTGLD